MKKKRRVPRALAVGKLITYHGRPWRIGMIGLTGGERYYWLVRSGGEVAIVPAFILWPTPPANGGQE